MEAFPIRHFAGNDECGGSNQVAVALVIVPLVKKRIGGKRDVYSRVVIDERT